MMELPIACTLSSEALAQAKEEYKAAQHLYCATARIKDGLAIIDLRGDKDALGPFLRRMVTREERCCAFLAFELVEVPDGFCLRMSGDAVSFAALAILVETLFPQAVTAPA